MRGTFVCRATSLVVAVLMLTAPATPARAGATVPTCQTAIFGAARGFLTRKLASLGRCTDGIFKCVQTAVDAKLTECLQKAGSNCVKRFADIADGERRLIAGIADVAKCGGLSPEMLLQSDQLGFAALADRCAAQFGTALTDATSVATCILQQFSCQSDALFEMQQPRAMELLELAGIPSEYLATQFPCLERNGGAGERVTDATMAKQLVKCVHARGQASTKFLAKALTSLGRCEGKIEACNGKPARDACLQKLASSAGACGKARADLNLARSAPGLPKDCRSRALGLAEEGRLAVLRSPIGANHLATDCQCSAVEEDNIANTLDDHACLMRQAECRLSDLLSVAAPRSESFLGAIGMTSEDFICPPPSKGRTLARGTGGGIGDVVHQITQPGAGGSDHFPTGGTAGLGNGVRKVRTLRARRRVLPDSASQIVVGLAADTRTLRVAARELRSGRVLDGFFDIPVLPSQAGGELTLVAHFPPALGAACFDLEFVSVGEDGVGTPVVFKQGEVPPPPSTAVLDLVQVEQQDVRDEPSNVPTTGLEGVRWIAVSRDGEAVYVTSASDEIGLCVEPADPTLPFCSTDAECPAGGGPCQRVQKATPDGVLVFRRDKTHDGRLTFVEGKFDGQDGVTGVKNPLGLAVSLDSQFVYLASDKDSAVSLFARDAGTGRLTQQQVVKRTDPGITGIRGARSLVISPDSKHLYVAGADESPTSSAIALFARNNQDGRLTFVSSIKNGDGGIHGLGNVQHLAITDDGKNVYAASLVDNAVVVLARNAGTGALSFVELQQDDAAACASAIPPAGTIGLCAARNIAISPDDKFVYVISGAGHNDVVVFSRDTDTGKLTFVEQQHDGAAGLTGFRPTAATVSADGAHLFVAGGTGPDVNGDGPDRTVTVFARDAVTGRLTFVPNAGGSHVTDGVGVAVDHDGQNVYLTGERTNTVAVFAHLP